MKSKFAGAKKWLWLFPVLLLAICAAVLLLRRPEGFEGRALSAEELTESYARSAKVSTSEAQKALHLDAQEEKATYRVLSVDLETQDPEITPELELYCKTFEGKNGDFLPLEICAVYLNGKGTDGTFRPFSGQVFVQLRTDFQIFYSVNGDFLDSGTSYIVGGAAPAGLGESQELLYKVRQVSDTIEVTGVYCSSSGTLDLG